MFLLTILIVLCVYLKENFKGLKRLFFNNSNGGNESRPDKDHENEMMRKHFAKHGPDHFELNEDLEEEDEELRDQQDLKNSKRQVMQFYIDMMIRMEYTGRREDRNILERDTINSVDIIQQMSSDGDIKTGKKNDGEYCYPLCEKRFKFGNILRQI